MLALVSHERRAIEAPISTYKHPNARPTPPESRQEMRLTRSQIAGCVAGEVGAEVIRLERWRGKAMRGLEEGRREREGDPIQVTFLNALPQVDHWG